MERFMKIRFYLAKAAGNLSKLGLKLLKRNIPYYPGYIALRICPDFLHYVRKPDLFIAVTGTNGKSTVCGLLKDFFESQGNTVIYNNGFNLETGVATMFLAQKRKCDVGIMEIDEKLSGEIFKIIPPDYFLCTNLFRDSMRTNSSVEYIASKIREGIPQSTKLLLNADDLIVTSLADNRDFISYGISQKLSKEIPEHRFSDLVYCPKCGGKLEYKDVKYFQIGNVVCPNCGLKNPKRDYDGKLDRKNNTITIKHHKKESTFPLKVESIFNIYNYLSFISLLLELGYSDEIINKYLNEMKLISSRFESKEINGISLINHLAKGQNPVACSSVFEYVRKDEGKKCVILMLDDVMDARNSSETIGWYYDTDFEQLNDRSITKIIISGWRRADVYLRCLLAGINKDIIETVESDSLIAGHIPHEGIDKIFLLHDITSYDQSKEVSDAIARSLAQ